MSPQIVHTLKGDINMKSSTKFKIGTDAIFRIFAAAGLHKPERLRELSGGEYNRVFDVTSSGVGYILKIAPPKDAVILTHEIDLMRQEIRFYELLRERTDIAIPQIIYTDFSEAVIPAPFFIMEKLLNPRLDTVKLTKEERRQVSTVVADIFAKIHTIEGRGFGYEQNGLHADWYAAIRGMVQNLRDDCTRFGKPCKPGERLLRYIDKNQEILKKAEPVLVFFDLWNRNLFCDKNSDDGIKLAVIDPERCFWGDRIADFVDFNPWGIPLGVKACAGEYNAATARLAIGEPAVTASDEENIRYYIMLAYLGLIMYTERYARYKKWQFGYIRNAFSCAYLFKTSFDKLKCLSPLD